MSERSEHPKVAGPADGGDGKLPPSAGPTGRGPYGFDPVRLGRAECDAWVGYYRHDWSLVLRAAVAMVREGFGMRAGPTLLGAWYVLRANQAWAPYPDNDPGRARAGMRRFYALVRRTSRLRLDPARAAELEIGWWRAHREHQHDPAVSRATLVEALNALYAYVYDLPADTTRVAAELRARAMDDSDAWVAAGCDLDSPLLAQERLALVASYTALRDALDRRVYTV